MSHPAARRRRERTLTRAHHALKQLETSGRPVTIATIAVHAGVSRAWLYAETDLRSRIDALRTGPSTPPPPGHTHRPTGLSP